MYTYQVLPIYKADHLNGVLLLRRVTQTVLITLSKDLAQFWNVFDIVVILSMSGNTEDKKQ